MIPQGKLPPALYNVWGPQWGFVGYFLGTGLGALRLDASIWGFLRNVSFWLHFVVATVLLLLLPFTRFFHAIMSPFIVAYNTMREQEALARRKSARRENPEPVAQR